MDFSLVAPRGNKRKPKKVKIYLDTVWFTLPLHNHLTFSVRQFCINRILNLIIDITSSSTQNKITSA
mgnify:CR=1 FL=1